MYNLGIIGIPEEESEDKEYLSNNGKSYKRFRKSDSMEHKCQKTTHRNIILKQEKK